MTNKITLPVDFSFVQITDGSNSALVTNIDNTVAFYIGEGTPDRNSITHILTEDLTVSAPAVVWARLLRSPSGGYSKHLTVSTW